MVPPRTPTLWRLPAAREPAATIPLVAAGSVIPRVPTGWAPPGAYLNCTACAKSLSQSASVGRQGGQQGSDDALKRRQGLPQGRESDCPASEGRTI